MQTLISIIVDWAIEDRNNGSDERLIEIMDSPNKPLFIEECKQRMVDEDFDPACQEIYRTVVEQYS